MRHFLAVCFVFLAGALFAAEDENILVIEVGGSIEGAIEIELLPEIAPQHVQRIKELTALGRYDGIAFHRVIDGFMAQTGDVQFGTIDRFNVRYAGRGGSDFPNVPAEFTDTPFDRGVVGMARSQSPDSANSQFFIMFQEGYFLNGQYTVFGRVIEGMDVVDSIKRGHPRSGALEDPDFMSKVYLKADAEN